LRVFKFFHREKPRTNEGVNHFAKTTSATKERSSAEAATPDTPYQNLKTDHRPETMMPHYDQLIKPENPEYEPISWRTWRTDCDCRPNYYYDPEPRYFFMISWSNLKTERIHSFIHSGYLYSASSSPLLLRDAPETAQILCRSFTPKRHRQLQVKDLPKILTCTWRLGRNSNSRPSGRQLSTLPMSHHQNELSPYTRLDGFWMRHYSFIRSFVHFELFYSALSRWLLSNAPRSQYGQKGRKSMVSPFFTQAWDWHHPKNGIDGFYLND